MPGDIVELHVGDRVPADLRVLQLRTATVRAEQASLTGVYGTTVRPWKAVECPPGGHDGPAPKHVNAHIRTLKTHIYMLVLRMGTRVFAPCNFICVHAGESVSVMKSTEPVAKEDCELQAKDNMLFAGTAISNGICIGCVVSIGMDTEIGKIQSQIQVCSFPEKMQKGA